MVRVDVNPDVERMRRASWAFTTRRVPPGTAWRLLAPPAQPYPGDLVLARVDALGHHSGLQLPCGRRKNLFVGDEVVVVFGNRYASNQFEAVVPETLGPCQLVAGGGIAAKTLSWHDRIQRGPTQITPIGLVADAEGRRVNLLNYAIPSSTRLLKKLVPTICVVGTSMDSGKTDTAAYLVKGLAAAGFRAGYAKITGTGAGGDTWKLKDAGADPVLDFTDAGLASTYLASAQEVDRVFSTLLNQLTKSGVDAAVLEIADGVIQRETDALIRSDCFKRAVGGVILAAYDSMGASAGVGFLSGQNIPIIGLAGLLTAAPLQRLEATAATDLCTFRREDLAQKEIAAQILMHARARCNKQQLSTQPESERLWPKGNGSHMAELKGNLPPAASLSEPVVAGEAWS